MNIELSAFGRKGNIHTSVGRILVKTQSEPEAVHVLRDLAYLLVQAKPEYLSHEFARMRAKLESELAIPVSPAARELRVEELEKAIAATKARLMRTDDGDEVGFLLARVEQREMEIEALKRALAADREAKT